MKREITAEDLVNIRYIRDRVDCGLTVARDAYFDNNKDTQAAVQFLLNNYSAFVIDTIQESVLEYDIDRDVYTVGTSGSK